MGAALSGGGSGRVRAPNFTTEKVLSDILRDLNTVGDSGLFQGATKALVDARRLDPLTQALEGLTSQAIGAQGTALNQLGETAAFAAAGLQGLEDGGLPDDLETRVLNATRQTQSARGFAASPISALQEAANLGLSSERIRAQRLSQAQSAQQAFLGGAFNAAQPGLSLQANLTPTLGQLFGIQSTRFQGQLNARGQTAQNLLTTRQQFIDLGKTAGQAAGGI